MENEVKEIFSSNIDDAKFVIAFDEIFDREKLEVYNTFDLSSKRNFKMINDLIRETYESIFLDENKNISEEKQTILLQILNTQSKIMREQSMTLTEFLDLLSKICSSCESNLLAEISNYVDNNYMLNLDADVLKAKSVNKSSVNEQLIISDDYGKLLIKISYLERIMIPLISQFFIYNKANFAKPSESTNEEDEEDLMFADINQRIFAHLFNIVAGDKSENLQNKLFKMVYARVKRTSASAKQFWKVAETLGISMESASLDIYSKLLTNSIPKIILSKELNVVSYISSIIGNQILFLFSNKFKIHYSIVTPTDSASMFESNDDDFTDMERLEIEFGHRDEGGLVLNNIIAKDVVSHIDDDLGVYVTKQEVLNVVPYCHANPIQERVVNMITLKYFKSDDAIKRLDVVEYAKLLISCVKYLEKNHFELIPQMLMSKCIKQRERSSITGVKIKAKIESAKRYKELLDLKYSNFKSDIEHNIQSIISTIYSSSFVDEKGEDIFESTAKICNIAEEIVNLCFLV